MIISNGDLRYQGTLSDLVEKGQGRLELRTSRPDEALKILRERFPDADRQDNTLFVPVAEEESAGLVAELSKEGIPINGMNYRRDDLESLFMRLTDEEES